MLHIVRRKKLVYKKLQIESTDEDGGSVLKWSNTGISFGNLLATSFNSVLSLEKISNYQSILKGKIVFSINSRVTNVFCYKTVHFR